MSFDISIYATEVTLQLLWSNYQYKSHKKFAVQQH